MFDGKFSPELSSTTSMVAVLDSDVLEGTSSTVQLFLSVSLLAFVITIFPSFAFVFVSLVGSWE